jgi:putative transposase
MGVSRPPVVEVGAEVRYAGSTYTVTGLVSGNVCLADVAGAVSHVPVGRLLADPGFGLVAARPRRAALTSSALLDGVSPEVVRQALWWERHLVEVITGLPPECERGTVARPEYDPTVRSLRQREIAKVAELAGLGQQVALRTLQRARHRYEGKGLWGLVDGRLSRPSTPLGRADTRVVDAIRQAVAEQTDKSSGTVGRLRRRVQQILTEVHGGDVPPMPPKTTFYRLVGRIAAGKHTFGSARTRQSLAKRPEGPFSTVTAARPGEWVQIDSTPLDVRVMLDNGIVDRVGLTWMIDLATMTLTAAVLRPTTKAVDAALLLARTLTPEPMRPGWTDALRMARSVLPHRRLLELDQRLEHAAARPVIVPETIVCDHGKVYLSQTFRNACRAMGISVQPTHRVRRGRRVRSSAVPTRSPRCSPSWGGHVER